MEPDDAFHALSVLQHAVKDSEAHVRKLLELSAADRPEFHKGRFEELLRSLKEAREEKAAAQQQLENSRRQLEAAKTKEEATLKVTSAGGVSNMVTAAKHTADLERKVAGTEARLAAATRLSEVLDSQLRDARVTQVLNKLDAVCARQSKWLEACKTLHKACERAHGALTTQYRKLDMARKNVTMDESHHSEKLAADGKKRIEAAKEKLLSEIKSVLDGVVLRDDTLMSETHKARLAVLDQADRIGELHYSIAHQSYAARQKAEHIAKLLGDFHTAFADLSAANDRRLRGARLFLLRRMCCEAQRAQCDPGM